MSTLPTVSVTEDELHPHLLYRTIDGQAEFATWRLQGGQEALALFTTAEVAGKYLLELPTASSYTLFQPPREKLVAIFQACLAANVRIAALDPQAGGARTLFDLNQIVMAAAQAAR